jgi:hypothetical protein
MMIRGLRRVEISNEHILVDRSVVYRFSSEINVADSLKELYKSMQVNYPKFFKMDNLSKLGFLAAEILLEGMNRKDDIDIILCTSSSSLETDTAFQETIKDEANFFPSPSVFVYTLPNIVMGEICIRHNIHGENMMFIMNEKDMECFFEHASGLIYEMNLKKCMVGYLDCFNNKMKADIRLYEIINY